METIRRSSYLILLVLIALVQSQPTTLDCHGRTSLCVGPLHYKNCVDSGYGIMVTDDNPVHMCPEGTRCVNEGPDSCVTLKTPTTDESMREPIQKSTTDSTITSSDVPNELPVSAAYIQPTETTLPEVITERMVKKSTTEEVNTTSSTNETITKTVEDPNLSTSPVTELPSTETPLETAGNATQIVEKVEASTYIPELNASTASIEQNQTSVSVNETVETTTEVLVTEQATDSVLSEQSTVSTVSSNETVKEEAVTLGNETSTIAPQALSSTTEKPVEVVPSTIPDVQTNASASSVAYEETTVAAEVQSTTPIESHTENVTPVKGNISETTTETLTTFIDENENAQTALSATETVANASSTEKPLLVTEPEVLSSTESIPKSSAVTENVTSSTTTSLAPEISPAALTEISTETQENASTTISHLLQETSSVSNDSVMPTTSESAFTEVTQISTEAQVTTMQPAPLTNETTPQSSSTPSSDAESLSTTSPFTVVTEPALVDTNTTAASVSVASVEAIETTKRPVVDTQHNETEVPAATQEVTSVPPEETVQHLPSEKEDLSIKNQTQSSTEHQNITSITETIEEQSTQTVTESGQITNVTLPQSSVSSSTQVVETSEGNITETSFGPQEATASSTSTEAVTEESLSVSTSSQQLTNITTEKTAVEQVLSDLENGTQVPSGTQQLNASSQTTQSVGDRPTVTDDQTIPSTQGISEEPPIQQLVTEQGQVAPEVISPSTEQQSAATLTEKTPLTGEEVSNRSTSSAQVPATQQPSIISSQAVEGTDQQYPQTSKTESLPIAEQQNIWDITTITYTTELIGSSDTHKGELGTLTTKTAEQAIATTTSPNISASNITSTENATLTQIRKDQGSAANTTHIIQEPISTAQTINETSMFNQVTEQVPPESAPDASNNVSAESNVSNVATIEKVEQVQNKSTGENNVTGVVPQIGSGGVLAANETPTVVLPESPSPSANNFTTSNVSSVTVQQNLQEVQANVSKGTPASNVSAPAEKSAHPPPTTSGINNLEHPLEGADIPVIASLEQTGQGHGIADTQGHAIGSTQIPESQTSQSPQVFEGTQVVSQPEVVTQSHQTGTSQTILPPAPQQSHISPINIQTPQTSQSGSVVQSNQFPELQVTSHVVGSGPSSQPTVIQSIQVPGYPPIAQTFQRVPGHPPVYTTNTIMPPPGAGIPPHHIAGSQTITQTSENVVGQSQGPLISIPPFQAGGVASETQGMTSRNQSKVVSTQPSQPEIGQSNQRPGLSVTPQVSQLSSTGTWINLYRVGSNTYLIAVPQVTTQSSLPQVPGSYPPAHTYEYSLSGAQGSQPQFGVQPNQVWGSNLTPQRPGIAPGQSHVPSSSPSAHQPGISELHKQPHLFGKVPSASVPPTQTSRIGDEMQTSETASKHIPLHPVNTLIPQSGINWVPGSPATVTKSQGTLTQPNVLLQPSVSGQPAFPAVLDPSIQTAGASGIHVPQSQKDLSQYPHMPTSHPGDRLSIFSLLSGITSSSETSEEGVQSVESVEIESTTDKSDEFNTSESEEISLNNNATQGNITKQIILENLRNLVKSNLEKSSDSTQSKSTDEENSTYEKQQLGKSAVIGLSSAKNGVSSETSESKESEEKQRLGSKQDSSVSDDSSKIGSISHSNETSSSDESQESEESVQSDSEKSNSNDKKSSETSESNESKKKKKSKKSSKDDSNSDESSESKDKKKKKSKDSSHKSDESEESSESHLDTEENSKEPKKKFKCEKEGHFPDPNNCRKFYICSLKDNGKLKKYHFKCHHHQTFDPIQGKCSHEYICS